MAILTDSIGRVLGGRYRLVTALGSGASAHVFLAEDVTLGRRVAVKVLLPALVHDDSFLRRFQAEARAVAALSHPHVLQVFDWGEDADGPYLVTEYLSGGSLREILDRGIRLSEAQASHLGVDVAHGLAYAHARGLVHRDIKPANLLFDDEGRVRIADFGVARALAEAAWTEPTGAIVGTARYASPEQALGERVDGRADIYALALVLYETLTGVVPFTADTTLATLMARVGATLPYHPSLGGLEDTLAWAAAPAIATRPDAEAVAGALFNLANALPPPAPIPIPSAPGASAAILPPPPPGGAVFASPVPPDRGGWHPHEPDGTTILAAVVGDPVDDAFLETGIAPRVGPAEPPGPDFAATAQVDRRGGSSTATPFDVELEDPPTRAVAHSRAAAPAPVIAVRRRRRSLLDLLPTGRSGGGDGRMVRMLLILGAVVVVVAVSIVAAAISAVVPKVQVPGIVGDTAASATAALSTDHLKLTVGHPVYSVSVPLGVIVRQTPTPGASLAQGSSVTAIPSAGLPPETIPSLAGLTCAEVQSKLTPIHLAATCPAQSTYSATVATGQVISWSYGGKSGVTVAPYGAKIAVVVSKGKAPVPVPSVAGGKSYTSAAGAIQAVGLVAARATEPSTAVPAGEIVGTTPPAGTVDPVGSTVTVYFSTGPPTVTIPALTGDTVAQATAALTAVGLTVNKIYGPKTGTVFRASPAAGTSVLKGTAITLWTT